MNRTLEQMLRCFVHPLHDDSVQYLPTLEFTYNSQQNSSTGLTPFLANYGFQPLNPVTVSLPSTQTPTAAQDRIHNLQLLHQFAHSQVLAAQARFKELSDQHRLDSPFRVGQLVRISTADLHLLQHPSRKFRPRFVGPCKIVRQLSDAVYEVQLPEGVQMHNVFHASKLEIWHGKQEDPYFPVAKRGKQFVVEAVTDVDFNRNRSGLLFKVKWAGYPEDDSPWQPLRNLRDNAQLRQFLSSPTWTSFTVTPEYKTFATRFANSSRIP